MPKLSIIDGMGVERQVKRLSVVDAGGVERVIQRLSSVDAGGVERLVFQYFTVSASPTAVDGAANSSSGPAITTAAATATVTGGTAPFTYFWRYLRTEGTWAVNSTATPSTTFTAYSVYPGDNRTAQAVCQVTDANGVSIDSNPVDCSVVNLGTA